MQERRVERHEVHELEREEDVAPGRKVTNVNVAAAGTTNVQEQDVEEVGRERADEVERRETVVERRVR